MGNTIAIERPDALSVEYVDALAARFFKSGYFAGLTEYQLATLIFVGDALGLKPANAVFDLEVVNGQVRYKAGESFRKAADDVEELKASIEAVTIRGPDRSKMPIVIRMPNVPPTLDSANKGSPLSTEAERPLDSPEGKQTQGRPESSQRSREFSYIHEQNPGAREFVDKFGKIPGNYRRLEDSEVIRVGDLAWTDTGPGSGHWSTVSEGQTYLVGHEAARAICIIREVVQQKADAAADAEKGVTLDGDAEYGVEGPATERARLIGEIQTQLKKDGKPTLEQQKGFYLYADVNPNPNDWTLDDARKAHAALKPFLDRKSNRKK